MSWLANLPIKRKLTLVMLLTCTVVLSLAALAIALFELYDFRRALARDVTILADILGKNTRAALLFQDDDAARETLLALQAEPHITAACVYTREGTIFADYVRPGSARTLPTAPSEDYQHRFAETYLSVFRPINLDDKPVGTIYIESDLLGIAERLRVFSTIVAAVLLGSLVVAFLLSSFLQRLISGPILKLNGIAGAIAERKDYSLRATPLGNDEVGVLTRTFNHMVAGIEEREKALHEANRSLHDEISERKFAENKVQMQLAGLAQLHQITRAIGERQDVKSIFQAVVRSLEDQLPVDFSCVCLDDEATHQLTVTSVGLRSAPLAHQLALDEQGQISADEDGLSRCLKGELVYEPDVSKIETPFARRISLSALHSLVVAPLLVESRVFGVLVAARLNAEAFDSTECEFLRQLSEHVALATHQAQLYNALQQAYDDLRHTQQASMQQERLRALGQMASGIAHDINNAISPVALYTESLLEKEPNLSPRARDYLETIQRAIDDVAQTVARMREFYRQRETQLHLAPVDLNRMMDQVADLTRARWWDMPQQRGSVIELRKEPLARLPRIMGIENEIRDALTNLVFNAVDAMPDGGTLTLRTCMLDGAISKNAGSRHVCIEVIDTGFGMDEETRRRCLEPFYTTKGERGTGLGLAMVYGFAKRHAAEIEIESSIGHGTTVRLTFAVAEEQNPAEHPSIDQAVLPDHLRVLIVDDDPLLLKSLRDTLEADGHAISTANGGQSGIDTFRDALRTSEPFDAVISDLGMPYVDGRKVASTIKTLSPQTPVILLTGWGQRLATEGEIPPYVDHLISKPPKLRELREILSACSPKTIAR